MNLYELIERETHIAFTRRGKEYHGPCPFCKCGGKQFIIFASECRYWCRQCDVKGDAIQFVREYKGLTFHQAKEYVGVVEDGCTTIIHNNNNNHNNDIAHNNYHNSTPLLQPPSEAWTVAAQDFVDCCQVNLWRDAGAKALAWLHRRGLSDDTVRQTGLGYNARDNYINRQSWGLLPEANEKGRPKGLWLPRGITIPWCVDGALWGVRIRRPMGDPKYYWLPGGTANTLYNADALIPDKAAVLLEGEIDALTVQQQAGHLATAVATGSTHAARRTKWIARLSLPPTVLVAYDSDEAGEKAAQYWLDALSNARRWRPYWNDANDMAQDGVDIRKWLLATLPSPQPEPAAQPQSSPQSGQAKRFIERITLGHIGDPDFGRRELIEIDA